MAIRCIRDGIIFTFLDKENAKGTFMEKTKSGIEIIPGVASAGERNSMGRWALVLAIGPGCKEVKLGHYICIEPQAWTNSLVYDGVKIRKTDESKVMIVSKEKPDVHY